MQALQFSYGDKGLKYVQIDKPKIENERDILIKVAYAGICGTDLHIIQGEFPVKQNGAVTLGHELSGTVVEVGKKVTTVKIGDKVSVDPNSGCHCCHFCHVGNPHYCKIGGLENTIGIYRNGGWAEYLLAPEEQVHKLPEKITLQQATLCEPISCLAHGLDRISPIHIGQTILITGAGIIGNLWVVALHLQGHRKVTVSEPNKERLKFLEKLNTGFDCITPDVLKSRQESNEDYLFDLIIDCSGYAPAVENAFSMLKHGGKLCIFGVAPPHAKISISPYQIFKKELTIVGVIINPFTFPKAIGLMESMGDRYLNYSNLGVKVFKLSEYEAAIEELKKGVIAKAVFKM